MSIKNPIVSPSQMKEQINWCSIKKEDTEGAKNIWWNTGFEGTLSTHDSKIAKKMYILRDKILSFGGEQVSMPLLIDDDYLPLLNRGQFFYGKGLKMKKGIPSQCHYNSCCLWKANQGKCQIATGYAILEDGLWREHSWVVQPLATKYRIWETTVPRLAYFGYVMTDEECEKFYYDNI